MEFGNILFYSDSFSFIWMFPFFFRGFKNVPQP